MKKSFTMRLIVPLAVLFAFASLALAADQPTKKGKTDRNRGQARTGVSQSAEPGTDAASTPASDRDAREATMQRGRLPRHGQAPSAAAEEDQAKKKKKDNNSGKSSADEDNDEDGGTGSNN